MLVVILGAGASYDSEPDTPATQAAPSRPPLANELFDRARFGRVVDQWPECGSLMSVLRTAAKDGAIEQRLEALRDEGRGAPRVFRAVEAIRYYLREVVESECNRWLSNLHRVTVYSELVRQVEGWRLAHRERVTFITFNYDSLLEAALHDFIPELSFERMSGYISEPDYNVIKVHGSTDWWRAATPYPEAFLEEPWAKHELARASGPDHLILRATANFEISGRIQTTDERASQRFPFFLPALAIPTVTKSVFECPAEHISEMTAALNSMIKLIVIGWRGMEANFLDHWRKTGSPKLRLWQICSTENGARETEMNLNSVVGDRPQQEPARAGFSEYVAGGALERFLNAGE